VSVALREDRLTVIVEDDGVGDARIGVGAGLRLHDRVAALEGAVEIVSRAAAAPSGSRAAVRVIIAEDEVLLREGLTHVLEKEGFSVIGAVGTAADWEQAVDARVPDLAITDIRMPPSHTDEASRRPWVRHASPAGRCGVLSQHVQRRYATELLGAQAGESAIC
jgi:hypothetical protein